MRQMSYFCWMLCWVASAATAGPIEGPKEFKRDTVGVYVVKAKGVLDADPPAGVEIVQRPTEWFVTGKPGTYTVYLRDYWVDFDSKKQGLDKSKWEFTIAAADGEPPVPPGPDPGVRTNPFTDDAPRVLMVWDPFGPALTVGQLAARDGEESRKAVVAFAGENGYRIWPKGQATKDPVWASAMQKLPTSYPWVMAGKGKAGYAGPVNGIEDVKAAIAKAAGPVSAAEPIAPPVAAAAPAGWDVTTAGGQTFYTRPQSFAAPACTTYRNARGQLVTVCP